MEDLSEYMNIEYKPNFKVAGKLFGKDMKDFTNYLTTISEDDINLLNSNNLVITLVVSEVTFLLNLLVSKYIPANK